MKVRGFLLAIIAVMFFSGCAVRTYEIQQNRVDQDLATGNRGTLKGDVPKDDLKDRKTTRKVKVVELELLPLKKSLERSNAKSAPGADALQQGPSDSSGGLVAEPSISAPVAPVFEEYTVQENDTLQKIAHKYYGSFDQWVRIYEANRDVLKGPDNIHPKQKLRIPVAEKTK
jgi:nucleoid-associated protein YgaU